MTQESAEYGKPPPRWLTKLFTRINVLVYELSGGRLMNKFAGDPIVLVKMKGAKSGQPRTTPLMYVHHGDSFILVASDQGSDKNPVWYYNLKAHPDITIVHNGKRHALRARLLDGEEKATLWPICDAAYAEYATYRKRTERDIPMFICEPKD